MQHHPNHDARLQLADFVLSLAGQMFQRCQTGEPVAHVMAYFDQVAADLRTGSRVALLSCQVLAA